MPDIAKLSDISRALDIDITEILGDGSSAQAIKKVVDNTPEPLTTKELMPWHLSCLMRLLTWLLTRQSNQIVYHCCLV